MGGFFERRRQKRLEERRKAEEQKKESVKKEAPKAPPSSAWVYAAAPKADENKKKAISEELSARLEERNASRTRSANMNMMRAEEEQRKQEISSKKGSFEKIYDKAGSTLDEVQRESEEVGKADITHTASMQGKVQLHQGKLSMIENTCGVLDSNYSVLEYDQGIGYRGRMERLRKKLGETKALSGHAVHKVEKSAAARSRYQKETQNARLMRMVKKIAELGQEGDMGEFQMIPGLKVPATAVQPQQNQTGAAGQTGTAAQTQQPEEEKESLFWRGQEKATKLADGYDEHADIWVSLASDINDTIFNHFDMLDFNKKGVKASGKSLGGVFGVFGALCSAFKTWNTFVNMMKKDYDMHERGEKKDAADRWQDAREGLEAIVELISNTLGAIGNFGGDMLSGILGIISNCATLFMKCISVADSSARIAGVNHRKNDLWDRIQQKRAKYEAEKDMESAGYYDLPNKWGAARKIKAKRRELREKLAGQKLSTGDNVATEKNVSEVSNAKFQHISKSYGDDYTTLSDKIIAEKERRKEGEAGENAASLEDKTTYKRRLHMMEALELLERFYEEDQAQNRQIKILGHALEESAVESVSMASNLAKVSVVGAGVGAILSVASSTYKVVSSATKFTVGKIRGAMGHDNDKSFRRNEMAMTMFDSVAGLTNTPKYGLEGGVVGSVDQVKDMYLDSAAERLHHVRGMMAGLDVHLDPLMTAENKGEFIASLSSAFSEDGNG